MFGFNECESARDAAYEYQGTDHESHFSHELVAGAAAFMGMKEFENHQRNEGKEVSHGFAKELIAGFAGAEVDKLAETKGLDFLDREKAKHHAKKQAEHLYEEQYGDYDNFDPNQTRPHPSMRY